MFGINYKLVGFWSNCRTSISENDLKGEVKKQEIEEGRGMGESDFNAGSNLINCYSTDSGSTAPLVCEYI